MPKLKLMRLQNGLFKSISQLILLSFLMIFSSILWAEANQAGSSIVLNRPPDSLANWYSPVAKRHIWLHTMFRLQRAMLAMNDYANKGKHIELRKWSDKFTKDYESIGKMVPEWAGFVRKDKLEALNAAVTQSQFSLISPILETIAEACTSCHDGYQTVAALLYRSADFSQQSIRVTGSGSIQEQGYVDAMRNLAEAVNHINIAIKDNYLSEALAYISPLEQQLNDLSTNCASCHKDDQVPVNRIFDASARLLPELAAILKSKDGNQAGQKLGEFAVVFCGRCHGVHRTLSHIKNKMN